MTFTIIDAAPLTSKESAEGSLRPSDSSREDRNAILFQCCAMNIDWYGPFVSISCIPVTEEVRAGK